MSYSMYFKSDSESNVVHLIGKGHACKTGHTRFCVTSGQSAPVSLPCSVPQGSRIGPQKFIVYTKDIAETIAVFSLNHHLHADDTQLQKNLRIEDIKTTRLNLELYVAAVKDWCSSRWLQLNADKTDLIWFGSRSNLKKLTRAETSLQLGSTTIEPAAVAWNFGVMDSELNMRVHIGKVAAICFFHLRRLCKLRSVLTSSSMLRLVSARPYGLE